ncbi:MAG TPA: undecaprenyl/decaprenyl-phosphate alpha-N-acetylglucosaminyl 1-phosphate transferase [Planctomycetes bacterium]|nr:undecaprenyl/decaprenyl-phosphate alpha-N-acetylglucosaminyl 1-phosphate transferase [Planctomycetota bacterium]
MSGVFTAFLAALVTGGLAAIVTARLARAAGFLDHPGTEAHKSQERPVALGGGVAVAVGFAAALAVIRWKLPQGADGVRFFAVFCGAGALLLIGIIDDLRRLGSLVKFVIQAMVFMAVIGAGVRITLFVPSAAFSVIVTFLWMAGLTNAFNLIDNHDGVAGGVGAIGTFMLALVCASGGDAGSAAVLAALSGGLAGFLLLNFPPARLYLGDAGSLSAGFLMAGMSIIPSFYREDIPGSHLAVLAPVFVFAVPLFDTTRVILVRLRAGAGLFEADNRHFSHRLRQLGVSGRGVAGVNYLFALVAAAPAIVLRETGIQGALILLAQLAGVLLLILIIERAGGGK